jgi:cyclophilin family peptidyl-prolyl cis-trans isomerase/protein-disulfide isomerase
VKNFIPLLLVLTLVGLLGACLPAPQPEVTEPPAPTIEISTVVPLDTGDQPTCIPYPPPPTPSEEDLAVFTPDPETDWIKGRKDAPITIIEYADFQCPACSRTARILQDLVEKYPDDVRIVYRHFPLDSIHDKAIPAAQAAEAAGRQGDEAFWAMHDYLYDTQAEWSGFSVEDFASWVVEVANELGLDTVQFEADYSSEAIVNLAEAAWTDGQALGITGTPFLMVNSLYNIRDAQMLTAFVELIKLEERLFTACPPMTIDPDTSYQATVETEKGSFVIDLYVERAPLAVNSFVYLAEEGWFDGNTFHIVLPGIVAQTGDPSGTGYGNPGYRFGNETSPDLLFDREGLVAMYNTGPDSNGSQFFITYAEAPDLNGYYTIFGEVVEGMDVVRSITPRNPQIGEDLPPGDQLISITIEKQ